MASDIGAANASQILAASREKPGTFKIRTGGAVDIRRTLDQLGAEANRKQIINSALLRLRGISEGIIQPEQEWETVAGFLQLTGKPFKLSLDDKGQIEVEAQSESELKEYLPRQKQLIQDASAKLEELIGQADFEDTKSGLRAELAFGILRIEEMKNYSPPEEFWERRFQTLSDAGRPVKLVLDGDGNKVAQDQLEHNFFDVENVADRQKLLNARDELRDILSGKRSATEGWHFTALGNQTSGDDYFLDLDDDGDIVVQRNKITTVTPAFLEADEDGPETDAKWQEEALRLYAEGKGFHFDFESDGQTIKVVENTLLSLTRDVDIQAGQEKIRSALVSLLA
jgi:hypothetical protein